MKEKSCFKSANGKCIDLIISNRKYSFQHTGTVDTGLSDHHHLIYSMLKTRFVKVPPKRVNYRDYSKLFSNKIDTMKEKILLVENERIIDNDSDIADIFNRYFNKMTETLDIPEWNASFVPKHSDQVKNALDKFANHPSIHSINNSNYRKL